MLHSTSNKRKHLLRAVDSQARIWVLALENKVTAHKGEEHAANQRWAGEMGRHSLAYRLSETWDNCYQNTNLCWSRIGVRLDWKPVHWTTIPSCVCTLSPWESCSCHSRFTGQSQHQGGSASHKRRVVFPDAFCWFPVRSASQKRRVVLPECIFLFPCGTCLS